MTGRNLFGDLVTEPLTVKLDRDIDRDQRCCENLARIHPGKGPHAAELRCAGCDKHRGWLRQEALDFIKQNTARFGATTEPLVLRNQTIGDHQMSDQQYDNTDRGALFKNTDKSEDKHPDYRGTINVAGTEFWLSAWLKTSKKGVKFMSLSVKPKDAAATSPKKPAERRNDFDDAIPF